LIKNLRSGANRLRYWALDLIFRGGVGFACNNEHGRELLLASLAPQAGERILHLSVRGARSGLALAKQFPEAYFVAVETEESALVAINKRIRAQKITNLEVLPLVGCHFHSEAASFDKAVSLLMLHPLRPADKLAFLKEILRVLRRGGTLHIGNLDTPHISREQAGLKLARYLFGEAAAQAHLDGTWVKMLREVGFSGVRHMASYSTTLGRVVLVRARRPIN
jgi:cyclopropane fatty-acyl-phospholipid synthase-like methyltransferase